MKQFFLQYIAQAKENGLILWRKGLFFSYAQWHTLRHKDWNRAELAVLFSLAFVLGITCKTIAIHTVTIGYEDYLVPQESSLSAEIKESSILKGPICEE